MRSIFAPPPPRNVNPLSLSHSTLLLSPDSMAFPPPSFLDAGLSRHQLEAVGSGKQPLQSIAIKSANDDKWAKGHFCPSKLNHPAHKRADDRQRGSSFGLAGQAGLPFVLNDIRSLYNVELQGWGWKWHHGKVAQMSADSANELGIRRNSRDVP